VSHGAADDPPPGGGPRWVDDHCHLDRASAETTVAQAAAAGVERLITVGTDAGASEAAVAVARAHDGVWATAGVHPHEATEGVDGIVGLLDETEVVAVGECGLDYHYDHSPRPVQRRVFAEQIALARERRLPLVIHTREAWDDTFTILEAEGVPEHTVFHCFTGGPSEAARCTEMGAHLSISGIVTFGTAADLRAAVAATPLDRLLVETDSPYLAPVPHRGKRNVPAWVPVVGAAVAEVKGLPVGEVAAATWATTARVYGLPEV
jgi:TatD DNase family protein